MRTASELDAMIPTEPVPIRPPSAEFVDRLRQMPDHALKGDDPAVIAERERRRLEAQKVAMDGLRTLSWADIMSEPDEPPPVIRDGVPEVGVTVVAGAPKVGKTLWCTQIALETRRPTLMVIEEGSRAGLNYRFRHQAAALGVTDPAIHLALRQRIRLDEPKSVERVRAYVDAAHIELVILDPLNRLHGVDENRPADMTRVMDGLAEIAYQTHTAVIAVHHLSKPSAERRGDIWDRFRGASSIRSGTDANLVMDGTGDTIHLVGEFRDAEPMSEWMELDRESLTFRSIDPPEAVAKVDPAILRTYVKSRGQVIARQVMEEYGVTKMTALKALRGLGCDEFSGIRNTLTFSLSTVQ